ncbi:MAG: hypothetical protein JXB07_16770 [Anaerolineae bacterium]|nr:hypothetical protein [Anaerolineae bacterium]
MAKHLGRQDRFLLVLSPYLLNNQGDTNPVSLAESFPRLFEKTPISRRADRLDQIWASDVGPNPHPPTPCFSWHNDRCCS